MSIYFCRTQTFYPYFNIKTKGLSSQSPGYCFEIFPSYRLRESCELQGTLDTKYNLKTTSSRCLLEHSRRAVTALRGCLVSFWERCMCYKISLVSNISLVWWSGVRFGLRFLAMGSGRSSVWLPKIRLFRRQGVALNTYTGVLKLWRKLTQKQKQNYLDITLTLVLN